MSFMAVAAVGSAVVGAAGSIIGGNKAAGAQQEATAANAALTREQMLEDRRQYDLARQDLAPYRDAGYTALGQLGKGTADGGEFNRNFTMADFEADPGYQFRMDEGKKALESSAAARGGALSGGALKAIARYGQDVASGEYGAAYNRYNNDLTTRFNRLSSLAGTGQTATNSSIAAGSALSDNLQAGNANLISGNNASANARASQYAGTAGAIGNAVNNVGSYFALKNMYPGGGGGGAPSMPDYTQLSYGSGPGSNMSGELWNPMG